MLLHSAVSFCGSNSSGLVQLHATENHIDLDAVALHHLLMMRLPTLIALRLTPANMAAEVVYRLP